VKSETKLAAGNIAIVPVAGAGPQLEAVRGLFLEYAQSLGFSLCFQGFDQELASLPGGYAPPAGCLLLATVDDAVAGCVGVRKLDAGRCEMKRLYVRPEYRGEGLGRVLAEKIIAKARSAGYRTMYLDTLPVMAAAQKLYESMGFATCAPYSDSPTCGARCMMLALDERAAGS
jgi:ribosomal protein S18 acetylase RimI-like enzyme